MLLKFFIIIDNVMFVNLASCIWFRSIGKLASHRGDSSSPSDLRPAENPLPSIAVVRTSRVTPEEPCCSRRHVLLQILCELVTVHVSSSFGLREQVGI